MNLDSKELLEHRNGHANRETCTKIPYNMYRCDLLLLLIITIKPCSLHSMNNLNCEKMP